MYNEDYFKNIGESYLSQSRIRDRGFNFIKTVNGCTFEITRHHNAWEGLGKVKKVVEKWKVDINEKTFIKVAERKFKKSDYDGYVN